MAVGRILYKYKYSTMGKIILPYWFDFHISTQALRQAWFHQSVFCMYMFAPSDAITDAACPLHIESENR